METIQDNFSQQALNWIRSFSRGSRIGLVVLAILVGVLLVNTNGIKSQPETCSLLGSCKLSKTECQQIELTLGTAGFEDYEIVEGTVQVPIKKKSECLTLLVEASALPIRLSSAPETTGMNIFQSRRQQVMAARDKKKAQVEQMIGRLPFVEQAWFTMDVAPSRTDFGSEKHSAVVSVQPLGKQSLDARQIATVRQIVSGAVAAVARKEIVVTDLNSGRAYQDLNGEDAKFGENFKTASWQLISAERQSYFEKKIAEVLQGYPGISFELEYELIPSSQVPPNRVAMLPKTQRKLVEGNTPSPNKFGTNGQVEIDQFADEGAQSRRDDNSMPLPFAFSSDSHKGHEERVAVSVRLSSELLALPGSGILSSATGESASLESKVERLKSEITEKLRPVLPESAFSHNSIFPIRFQVDEMVGVDKDDSILAQIQTYVKSYWSTIAVLLVGAMMLIVVGKSPSRMIEESPPHIQPAVPNSPLPPETVNDLDDDKRRDAEEKLSRLIDSDPEAAAQVIKSWIRDAA